MADELAVRIGTAERERAAQSLAGHLAAGRLELAEYDERVQQAYAARTADQLTPLFADLPADPAPRERRRPPVGPPPRRLLWLLLLLVPLLVLLSLGAVAHGHHPPFFLIPMVLVLVWVGRRRQRYWARG